MKLADERVLVTGAGGFIGSHLTELLARRGARVRAMVRYNSRGDWGHLQALPAEIRDAIEVLPSDVADPFAVDRAVAGCGAVFHLAALIGIPYSYTAPASYVEVNVRGTQHVLEAARRHGVQRVVHTSTSEVYGTARYTPIDEAHPLQAQSPYSASKIAADKLAESYQRSFGVPVVTLRPFNAYGPRQSARAVIPTIVSQAAQGGGSIRLGSLEPVRDFTFVTDTARAFVAMAEGDVPPGTVCNAGSGAGISIGDLARKILSLMKTSAEIVQEDARVRPEQSEVGELLADASALRGRTGWMPELTLEQGLTRAIAYVREHLDSYKATIYNV